MRLPQAFIERTRPLLGDDFPAFEAALEQESPVSIRLNPRKFAPSEILGSQFPIPDLEPVLWASDAFYLPSRPVFTLDPLFHAGCYYVQEASSMFLEHFVNQYITEPVTALDLCAAPGGKASQLSSLLPEGSLLVANEVIRSRAPILAENLIKWGNPNTVVTNCDPAQIGKNRDLFDMIVCDLPCSGEGLFRKDPKAVNEWSVDNVKLCAERQFRIVADIFPALKAGGILIYSTCTYNREENEENVARICGELGAEMLENPRRFWPHKTKGEGFFIAGIRKNGEENSAVRPNFKNLKVIFDGREILKNQGKEIQPNHALAMSVELPENAFPRWDLDLPTALNYLRREALRDIPQSLPKGYIIVTYKNRPLGFVKNIGSRANNLYPQEWKIRMR
ncbi:MAG: rRNA cytosine-C5-methyltransferase [Dysgonamonadaceae bacterium]|nr:rRNA cytosine-C5-methyltransferase [Dysgonamonadaceae bacterium]